jgi:hypothetical protein
VRTIPSGIVSDGLVLWLDAGITTSYPGSGTTWFDLSGNKNNATIGTGISYSNINGGAIVFPNSNAACSGTFPLNYAGGGFTMEVWIKHTGTVSTSRIQRYFTMGSSPVEGPVIRHQNSSNSSLHGYIFDASSTFKSIDIPNQIYTNTFYNLIVTYDGSNMRLYNNNNQAGILAGSFTLPTPTNQTITLSGDVTGSGTTSIVTTIASGAVEFSMMDPAAVVTAAEGIPSNNNDTTLPTSAAVKSYVDASLVGSLIFQGGYDALTNTPNLDSPPTGVINKGFMWTVTVDGFFFTEQVRVGDSLIANINNPTTLTDWTRVQSNIDLATLTTVGIGNVNAGAGISVSYSAGTATVTADTVSYAATVSSASSVLTHGLNTRDVIIQLYDTVTYETVYSDNIRTTTNTVTINFATTPTNPVRVLVQK